MFCNLIELLYELHYPLCYCGVRFFFSLHWDHRIFSLNMCLFWLHWNIIFWSIALAVLTVLHKLFYPFLTQAVTNIFKATSKPQVWRCDYLIIWPTVCKTVILTYFHKVKVKNMIPLKCQCNKNLSIYIYKNCLHHFYILVNLFQRCVSSIFRNQKPAEEFQRPLCKPVYVPSVVKEEQWLQVSEWWSLYLDMSACCLLSSLGGGGWERYGGMDQASQRWIRVDLEALQGNRAFIRKMGNSPLFYKEPLAFIDETNVCV